MRGMILAAGRGTRMGELTALTPKPLLRIADHYLIEYAIHALVKAHIIDIVINVCYQKNQLKAALGDGSRYGARFHYSEEDEPLETGGGILNTLSFFNSEPFVVVSGDVISNYPLAQLSSRLQKSAHIVLVDNPDFHRDGDFHLDGKTVKMQGTQALTYANIGIFRPEFFLNQSPGKFLLGTLLKEAAHHQLMTGEYFKGVWHNVGTKDQLLSLNEAPGSLPRLLF